MKSDVRKILAVTAALLLVIGLGSCGLFGSDVSITIKATGTDHGDNVDIYAAIAEGPAYNLSQLQDLSVFNSRKITPSNSQQSIVFTVPSKKTYTAFIFQDLNGNGEFDNDDTARMSSSGVWSYIEEDVEVSISYNY